METVTEEERILKQKEETRKRQERQQEIRAAMRPHSLTPRCCEEQQSEKKSCLHTMTLPTLNTPSLGYSLNVDPGPSGQLHGKEQGSVG